MDSVVQESSYLCVAMLRFKTPKRYGQQGYIADLVNVVLKDKKLEKRLNKLKPKLMLFDTSIENKDSIMVNNILVKIIDPVFLSDLLG
jgi:hypothetical protein